LTVQSDPQASLLDQLTSHTSKNGSEDLVKKAFVVARNIVGVAGLILAGYVVLSSIPDLGRYIKISKM
jgi:hypothetical protein